MASEEFRGLMNYRPPTEADIQRGIDEAMRDVIRHDARSNPNALAAPQTVGIAGAVRVQQERGWREETPLRLPPGQREIEQLTNAMLPHGPASKAK